LRLDEIEPDESIFSARFMGDRLYLVTFQQIDPFFVIDLSTDSPKILGELKIPGFSNYLHPFDDEPIIGVGRDTKEIENGRVQQLGIKIAL
ncbi:beta-propeller domain-containing protein, partial [Shewanella sp. A25]|nr:beta-propeller domain-containing protein [Shewanella shenzhenensis]